MESNLEKRPWWNFLDTDLKGLISQSMLLLEKAPTWEEKFHDYAFIVFPAAKAYEGFLKNLFLKMGFITKKDYEGKRFRIGKALNPSLDRNRWRGESVYDAIVDHCGGKHLADEMWDTWKMCRNLLFHWFPNEKNAIDLVEAKERVNQIITTMDKSVAECKIS